MRGASAGGSGSTHSTASCCFPASGNEALSESMREDSGACEDAASTVMDDSETMTACSEAVGTQIHQGGFRQSRHVSQ